jgi:lysophospholipase L1-like esterase
MPSRKGDTDVKTVILIGDSIRQGYQSVVQEELYQEAHVWAPRENGGTSRNVLAHLDEWVLARDPDIVHLNCGLHDLRTEFDATTAAVPLAEYRANVETILKQIREHTAATVIWATTTPVNEQWHHENKTFDRFEADVRVYNRQAREVAVPLGVHVNDLFEVVTRAGRDRYLVQDGVHFSEAGYALLGRAVMETIRMFL